MKKPKIIAIVGGGAAGFFSAINIAKQVPDAQVIILEKSTKLLSKVRISGGGRCNVTHQSPSVQHLLHGYPRGFDQLKTVFTKFNNTQTEAWFAQRGVRLHTEPDGRMFPVTNSSETIIECFLNEARQLGIQIKLEHAIIALERTGQHFTLSIAGKPSIEATYVLVAIGGHPQPSAYSFLEQMGHSIQPPIPSLFTFNDPKRRFSVLMGVSVPQAIVKITGSKFIQQGPLLLTHWGLSGPAILKLSAWAAPYLFSKKYVFEVLINWIGQTDEAAIRAYIQNYRTQHGKQHILKHPLYQLPQRLWEFLCTDAGVTPNHIWAELPAKNTNKLFEYLIRTPLAISGKTTFKDEFVTCGGVPLQEVDLQTMQSLKVEGLFFAGEVLHIDGITGGYNFQAAWSTAWVASEAIAKAANNSKNSQLNIDS